MFIANFKFILYFSSVANERQRQQPLYLHSTTTKIQLFRESHTSLSLFSIRSSILGELVFRNVQDFSRGICVVWNTLCQVKFRVVLSWVLFILKAHCSFVNIHMEFVAHFFVTCAFLIFFRHRSVNTSTPWSEISL